MARGKRPKGKSFKKPKEVEGKAKEEPARNDNAKKTEEKTSNRPSSCFRSEEIQEIRQLMNFDELVSIDTTVRLPMFYMNKEIQVKKRRIWSK